MASLDDYLGSLRNAYGALDGRRLATLLDPLNNVQNHHIQQYLRNTPNLRPSSYVSLVKTFFQDKAAFADFVAAYLLFIREHSVTDLLNGTLSHAQSASFFEAFAGCYAQCLPVLNSPISTYFVAALRKWSIALVKFAFATDRIGGDLKRTSASLAARLLTRTLSLCAAERSGDWPSKKNGVFFLANELFKIYFQLNNLRLCDTVIKNVRDALDALDTHFPKSDRVTFRYYMGRLYLAQRRPRKAMRELSEAFALCYRTNAKNRRLIAIYLITASLPLGLSPTTQLLQVCGLEGQYAPLIAAVKIGDWQRCLACLNAYKSWHLQKGTYLFLREKLEVICWRNLTRKTLYVAHQGRVQPTTGPPTLSLKSILAAARHAFSDPSLDLEDIESMCASLLDQGYIKAYIHQAMQLLVLQKGPQVGFPPVSAVRTLGEDP